MSLNGFPPAGGLFFLSEPAGGALSLEYGWSGYSAPEGWKCAARSRFWLGEAGSREDTPEGVQTLPAGRQLEDSPGFSLDFRGDFLSTMLREFYREKRSGTDVDSALDRLHAFFNTLYD